MGKKILLLHSYRDGTGKVRQRRLGDFANPREAVRQLRDKKWRQQLAASYPQLEFEGERLLERARVLLQSPAARRTQKSREATPASRRGCWHPDDPSAAGHLQTLRETVERLQNAGLLEEACAAQAELARSFPGQQAWVDHGVLLQRLGRWDEAVQEYSRLPYRDSLRHYQIASALCARGNPEESLEHVFRALTWDRKIADGLLKVEKGQEAAYWRLYGDLWTPDAKKFLLAVYNQSVVKMVLARAHRQGVKPRRLFRGHAISVILEQARDGVAYRKLPTTREIVDF